MMKALVKTRKGVGFLALQDVPEPKPGPGEVKVEVAICGVCGTDMHVLHDTFPYWPPVILGHEFAGTIVELGADCRYFEVGQRVVGEPHTRACGQCHLCRTGNIQICPQKRSPGWGIDGAMTQYMTYPERLLHRLPDGMTWDQAAVVEPTANAVTDLIVRTQMRVGDVVVVLGPGPIGLMTAMVARAAGARDVVVVGTPADVPLRLKKARELGFESVVNAGEVDPADVVLQMTGGIGADVVAECSGSPAAIASMVDLVRKRGKICVVGLTGNQEVRLPWDKFAFKVAQIIFNLSTEYEAWDRTIDLIHSGQVPAERLITHRAALADWQPLFTEIENRHALKGVLLPSAAGACEPARNSP